MLTTLDKVKNYLKIDITPDDEPAVQEYIDAVTAYIERYTGRTFTADTMATERSYDGTDSGELFIDDAIEVTQVKINGVILDSSDFKLYPPNRLPKTRIILPYKMFYEGAQNITVTAKWGYGEEIPADLSFAATVMVAGIVNAQNARLDTETVRSETIGRYSVTYADNSRQSHDFSDAMKTLKLYRRMS
jgi:Phage gp6-like head-tail connector protein